MTMHEQDYKLFLAILGVIGIALTLNIWLPDAEENNEENDNE